MKAFLLLLLAVLPPDRLADPALVRLEQALRDARTIGRVVCVAAHPDDEDGATLALLRHRYGLRTFCVFANRGEGGQNERGPELGRRLGAIREAETLAAMDLVGARAYFLGLEDFGYTKTAEEAFRRWGEERTVERLVRAIRALRPDVVFTNHDPDHGHGQHRAVARALRRAFDLAGDEGAFPEHGREGLEPWEPTLLLERLGAPGGAPLPDPPPDASSIVSIDTALLDPVRGLLHTEIAHLALKRHASQGRWERFGDGRRIFRVVARRHELFLPPEESPFDPLALTRLRVFRALAEQRPERRLEERLVDPGLLRMPDLSADGPDSARALALELARRRDALPRPAGRGPLARSLARDLDEVRARIDEAIALALGLRYEVHPVDDPAVAPRILFEERLVFPPDAGAFEVEGDQAAEFASRPGTRTRRFTVTVPPTSFTVPLDASPAYDAFDPMRTLGSMTRTIVHEPTGLRFTLERPISADVRPPVLVEPLPECLVLRQGGPRRPLVLLVDVASPLEHDLEARVRFGPAGERRVRLPLGAAGVRRVAARPPEVRPGVHPIDVSVADDRVVVRGRPRLAVVSAKVVPGVRVGVVRSYDGTLLWALESLGVEARELDANDLLFGDLARFDLVLVDIRALLVRPELDAARERLFRFVENGGTLGVFYHKTMEWNPRPLSPWRLPLTRDRVTREDAAVRLLAPDHPLLARPNRLGPSDFEGWVQERGLYFPAADHDPRLVELLETGDPGDAPLRTGLLAGDLGRGHYVYTSLVWYRQWRAGVPGAFRFLANLVSYAARTPP